MLTLYQKYSVFCHKRNGHAVGIVAFGRPWGMALPLLRLVNLSYVGLVRSRAVSGNLVPFFLEVHSCWKAHEEGLDEKAVHMAVTQPAWDA